jgi:RNA-binding protein
VVHVGKDGVTKATLDAVGEALNTRELLKVKVLDAAPLSPQEAAAAAAEAMEGVQVVQVIGRTVVLYRTHPDQPKIVLPR